MSVGCNTPCANLLCSQYGCQRVPRPLFQPWPSAPLHPMYYPDQTRPVIPVDAEQVRQIVREELERMKAAQTQPPTPHQAASAAATNKDPS